MSEDFATTCSARIAELAQDPRFASRAEELDSLGADLATEDSERWAGVDLFAAFPPESIVRLRHRHWLESAAGVLAAISVFLPVGWTWHGFQKASAAYESMIQSSGEPEGSTFLGLWATGFDGRLDGVDRLAPMAMVSFSLILFAVFWIVVHRMSASVNVRREEAKLSVARTELLKALTGASMVLNTRRADHPQRVEDIIKGSLDKLRKTHESVQKATTVLAATTERVNAEVGGLLESVLTARTQSDELLTKAAAVGATLETTATTTSKSVTDAVASLDTAVRDGIATTQKSMTQASKDLADRLDDSVGRLTESATTAIGTSGSALVEVVGGIGQSAEATSSAAAAMTQEIEALRQANGATSSDLSARVAELRLALAQIEDSLNRHDGTLQGQVSEISAARDAAERMLRHLTAAVGASDVPVQRG